MVQVSVIVPIYNKENYLKRCVASILSQTLKDIEVLLINDGSTDASLEICREFAEQDPRVKVIDKENEGVSATRNLGIRLAAGEYIAFVDADDYIEPEMYESMWQQCLKTKTKVCLCNYFVQDGFKKHPVFLNVKEEVLVAEEIHNQILLDMIAPPSYRHGQAAIGGFIWRLLISKTWLRKEKIIFFEQLPLREDLVFCVALLARAEKICIERAPYYNYIVIEDSAGQKFREDFFEINLQVNQKIRKQINRLKIYEEATDRLNKDYLELAIGALVNEVHQKNPATFRQKVKRIGTICTNEEIQTAIQNINPYELDLKRRLVFFTIKYRIYPSYIFYILFLRRLIT